MKEETYGYVIIGFGSLSRENLAKKIREQPEVLEKLKEEIEKCRSKSSLEQSMEEAILQEEGLRALMLLQDEEEEKLCKEYGIEFMEKYRLLQNLQRGEKIKGKYKEFLTKLLAIEKKYGWIIRPGI
ncbi:MAG: hypothetical protein N3G19_01385 [Candidatus Pacearchaeota archaeon]|nr:hypothetical protein [Candidatus Pacearchaeota archaeon]